MPTIPAKRMKRLLTQATVLLLLLVAISGCKEPKEPTNRFTLNFAAKYGTESFALNTAYTNSDGRKLNFEKFKFFVSHITLIKNDNSEVEVKDVALIDFSKPTSLQISADIDEADFKAIRIGLGVDSIQNLTTPQQMPSSSALSKAPAEDMHWDWLKYIFTYINGKYAEAGSENYYGAVLYHIGTNPLYYTINFNKAINVCCEKETQHTVTLDVKKIFDGPPVMDLATENVTESQVSKYAIAEKFAGNFAQAFSIE